MGEQEDQMERDPAGIEAEVEAHARTPEEVAQELAESATSDPGGDDVKGSVDKPKPPVANGNGNANGAAALSVLQGGKPVFSEKPNDAELRDAFLRDGKRYAFSQSTWREYVDGVWVDKNKLLVEDHVQRVIDSAGRKVNNNASRINSVSEMAMRRVAVADDVWDADEEVIACRNGVLHIPTRTLYPHAPERYLTAKTDYDYDPTANAPNWMSFLSEFTDEEKVLFLQEYAGECLTTHTRHELAAWMYGPRGGGRSTFTMGLETAVGPRAGVLGLAKLEKSQFALGDVVGKTLLTATEQPGGYTNATFILNALVSGDTIEVEKKYKDPFKIIPKAKLLWSMNALPRIQDPGDGLFRRVAVVEIPKPEGRVVKPELKDKIKGEGAGILNWALEGLARLRARGEFDLPASVREATARFETKNDIPGTFVEDMCATGPGMTEQAHSLYVAYSKWCLFSGHRPQSETSVADDWERLGFEKYKSKGKRRYRGVMLNMEALADIGIEQE